VLRILLSVSGAPAWLDAAPDWRIALFAIAAGFLAAVIFGLMPALQVARRRHRTTFMRHVLIGAQVAASCVLLIVAGLLGRAVDRAISAHPGFDYERVVAINPGLRGHGYAGAKARAYLDALQARLAVQPGVQATSLVLAPPLGRVSISAGVDTPTGTLTVMLNRVDPEFLGIMRIPVLRGRNLQRGDTRAVVVGESLARSMWPGEDPLGKKLPVGQDYTVVGVAGSARINRTEDSDAVEAYLPIETGDLPSLFVLARTTGSVEELARSAMLTARSLDPSTFPEVQTLKSGMARKVENVQATALAVSALGGMAQLLACLGIVGVVSFAVSQRTKEIGIRMALGARPGHVLRIVLARLVLPVAIGLLAGAFGAAALSQALRRELFGISHLDPAAYAAAIGIFVVTAAVAALVPARRALRVDPLRALRWE
jgi:predicted permease